MARLQAYPAVCRQPSRTPLHRPGAPRDHLAQSRPDRGSQQIVLQTCVPAAVSARLSSTATSSLPAPSHAPPASRTATQRQLQPASARGQIRPAQAGPASGPSQIAARAPQQDSQASPIAVVQPPKPSAPGLGRSGRSLTVRTRISRRPAGRQAAAAHSLAAAEPEQLKAPQMPTRSQVAELPAQTASLRSETLAQLPECRKAQPSTSQPQLSPATVQAAVCRADAARPASSACSPAQLLSGTSQQQDHPRRLANRQPDAPAVTTSPDQRAKPQVTPAADVQSLDSHSAQPPQSAQPGPPSTACQPATVSPTEQGSQPASAQQAVIVQAVSTHQQDSERKERKISSCGVVSACRASSWHSRSASVCLCAKFIALR